MSPCGDYDRLILGLLLYRVHLTILQLRTAVPRYKAIVHDFSVVFSSPTKKVPTLLYKIVHSWTVRIQHSLARPKTHFHHPNSPTPLTRGTEPPYFIVSVLLPVLQSWATVAFVHSRVKTPESVAVSAQRPTGLP